MLFNQMDAAIRNIYSATISVRMSRPIVQSRSQVVGDPDGNDEGYNNQSQSQSLVVPSKVITIADYFEKKDHSWLVTSQIPTDLSVQVQDATFTVHKYPLASKCGYIGCLDLQPSNSDSGYHLKLENFPGGPETFEIILKFCYGLLLDLNPNNIAQLRCASEFLEMSEELEDGNLISKTESFLTFIILSSWKDTITILKSCENLSPWAENLQIVRRCCDSIAWRASRDHSAGGEMSAAEGWWFEDVATLRIDYFKKIMTAMRMKGTKPEIIGKYIMQFASRWLLGIDVELEGLRGYGLGKNEMQFSVLDGRKQTEGLGNMKEQRAIVESLVSLLPHQKEAVPCDFLLKMLKVALIYSASPALVSELEKRVGMVLDNANVSDLLIPNYRTEDQGTKQPSEQCTMHNIDVVQRIIEYFLMHEQEQQHQVHPSSGKFNVSKLLDNYLAEIARDPNLSITKFQVLAEGLPDYSRTCDDGLYRAIDTYLKTHPSLPENDRRRLCKVMNCEKLSLDACTHAAQNDRLPLRTVIQVLFTEQVKMRAVMKEKGHLEGGENSEQDGNEASMRTEVTLLRAELENVKSKMAELQRDYSELQHEYGRLSTRKKSMTGWAISWKKIRRPTLFHGKQHEAEEIEETRPIPDSVSRKAQARRQSIA